MSPPHNLWNPAKTERFMHGQASIVGGAAFEGRYEVQKEIGSGGFGTVYQAKQLATGQLVAIKLLRWQEQGPAYDRKLARFLREMRLCARLHHPNIVRLIDSGHGEGGPVYTVFDFVPGDNLSDVLAQEGALDPVEARHLMLQVLDGLACAHANGIVHRDLKPKNIMITPGARRNALILDFGIGAITDGDEKEDLTVTGEILGSPGYAAPEQFLRSNPSPRSDLFSWALVFLECLTGVAAEPIHRLVLQRLDPEPVAIPAPLADHPLGDILRRALVKDVSAREVTADALLRQLEACDVRDLPLSALSRDTTLASGPSSRRLTGLSSRLSDTQERTSTSGARLPRRERRQVTAVCCRIDVRPAGSRPEDLEEADEQLDAVQRLVAENARRLGGWVVGAGPDAVVACFGYPTARNDDATRAAQAALGIAAALRQRGPGGATLPPGTLPGRTARTDVSIGVHTGMVMARDTTEAASALGPLVGTTLRVAVEIARGARPGAIVASAETRRLTENLFDYQAEGALEARGPVAAPVETFSLVSARSLDAHTPASVRQTPFIGRERDLAIVTDLADKARRGAGQSLLLHGEPGIGKSRLAREAVRHAQRAGFTVLEGRCTPDTVHRALHPIIDLLERTLELGRDSGAERTPADETGPRDGAVRKIEALAQSYGFDAQELVPLFATLLGVPWGAPYQALDVSPTKLKEMTREAILSLFFEMADAHPLVLLLEDLHWSDPSTRELLAKLTADASGAPILVLMTARPEFVPPWSPSSVTSLSLSRLERAEAEQLVSQVTRGAALPAPVLARIVERTDGVPLFVEELVSALTGSGELVVRGGRYELVKPLSEVNVPSTLRASLTARLDRLGRAKQTAQFAAVIGREFRLDVLTALHPEAEAEIRADLEILIAADLVHGRRRRRDASYSFRHALIRDAAYELLPKDKRREIHSLVARTLESKFPDLAESRPEVLAKHHGAAGEARRAVDYVKRAAMGALQRSANAEVVSHVEEARVWLEAIPAEHDRAAAELELLGLLLLAQMSTLGYGAREVAQTIARSEALLSVVGEGPLATTIRWATLFYHHIRAERPQARALATALVQAAESRGDVDQLAAALPSLGQCFYLEGNLVEAHRCLERALSVYDAEKHRAHGLMYGLDSRVYAQSTLGIVSWMLGRRREAWAHGEAAIAHARELRHAPSEAVALLYFSGLPHYEQNREKVVEVTETLAQLAERYGLLMYKGFCGVLRGWADGDAESALRHLDGVRATGHAIAMSYFLSLVAECEARTGAHEAALSHIEEALRHAETSGEMYYTPNLYRLKGMELLVGRRAGDKAARDAAEESLRKAIALAREHSQHPAELRASLALGELLRSEGRRAEARELVSIACNWNTDEVEWGELALARTFVAESAD